MDSLPNYPKEFDPKEVEKLRNFLNKALLSKYFTPFLSNGVYRVKDLQEHVKDEFLLSVNMSQPERDRFWKNVEQTRKPLWKLKQKFRRYEDPDSSIYEEIGQSNTTPVSGAILISHQEIVELGIIGTGNFGEVSRGMWRYNHNMAPKPVAVKIVSTVSGENRDQIMKEAEVWNKLEHENIVRLYGVTVTQPYKMIMELAPKGSLDKYLRSKVNQLSIERMWQYSCQISKGMEYLHSKRIIHRDLACRNVLLSNDTQVCLLAVVYLD
ncbi:Activated CDC42 kinase 1 [Oopsacas minuta]|uniref:non-specific protein-tyrosine kinase n=1 Tax=Oopsacas minuta TaxID=111878 RepID=A0AAV7JWS4_9METZ|nr:Activated CDC42 kinase 1 [Oopsacas minuta]